MRIQTACLLLLGFLKSPQLCLNKISWCNLTGTRQAMDVGVWRLWSLYRNEVGIFNVSALIVFGINIMLIYLFKLTRFAQQIAAKYCCHFVCLDKILFEELNRVMWWTFQWYNWPFVQVLTERSQSSAWELRGWAWYETAMHAVPKIHRGSVAKKAWIPFAQPKNKDSSHKKWLRKVCKN